MIYQFTLRRPRRHFRGRVRLRRVSRTHSHTLPRNLPILSLGSRWAHTHRIQQLQQLLLPRLEGLIADIIGNQRLLSVLAVLFRVLALGVFGGLGDGVRVSFEPSELLIDIVDVRELFDGAFQGGALQALHDGWRCWLLRSHGVGCCAGGWEVGSGWGCERGNVG